MLPGDADTVERTVANTDTKAPDRIVNRTLIAAEIYGLAVVRRFTGVGIVARNEVLIEIHIVAIRDPGEHAACGMGFRREAYGEAWHSQAIDPRGSGAVATDAQALRNVVAQVGVVFRNFLCGN
jgi:hypothetical protein